MTLEIHLEVYTAKKKIIHFGFLVFKFEGEKTRNLKYSEVIYSNNSAYSVDNKFHHEYNLDSLSNSSPLFLINNNKQKNFSLKQRY